MQAWIVVGCPENFELYRERGFDLAAFKASRGRQASTMEPGDRLVFYLTGAVQFGGIVEVTSASYEDSTDIGLQAEFGDAGEAYPYRIETRPFVIPPVGAYVEVREITDLLDKTRALGPKKLGMAFRGNLHRITPGDYATIERLLRAQAGSAA